MATNINRSFRKYGWCSRIRGLESGGAVEGLPVHSFHTDDSSMHMKRSTEIVISDRREFELEKNGFMPLIHRQRSDIAFFYGAQSLQKPTVYNDHEATVSAHLMAQLPYLFACCSIVHYMRCMVRDRIDSYVALPDMELLLNTWLSQYVAGSTVATEHDKARRPLAAAKVVLEEVKDTPGFANAELYLRPHYQLEDPMVALSLVTRLPHPGLQNCG